MDDARSRISPFRAAFRLIDDAPGRMKGLSGAEAHHLCGGTQQSDLLRHHGSSSLRNERAQPRILRELRVDAADGSHAAVEICAFPSPPCRGSPLAISANVWLSFPEAEHEQPRSSSLCSVLTKDDARTATSWADAASGGPMRERLDM
jgi:hypothetical protein